MCKYNVRILTLVHASIIYKSTASAGSMRIGVCTHLTWVRNFNILKTFSGLSNKLPALNKASDWLIWRMNLLPTFQILEHSFSTFCLSCHGGQFTYSYVSWFSHTSISHKILSKQLAAFPHALLSYWWKTN